MKTEAIDKLFLELSQFTNATTNRELALENELNKYLMFTIDDSDTVAEVKARMKRYNAGTAEMISSLNSLRK